MDVSPPARQTHPSSCAVLRTHRCQNGDANGRRGHAPPHPTGAKERTGALEPAADHPWTERGVGVRVLVRAGSEKCRDVKPYDVMCPAQLRVNHRWGAWWSGVAS